MAIDQQGMAMALDRRVQRRRNLRMIGPVACRDPRGDLGLGRGLPPEPAAAQPLRDDPQAGTGVRAGSHIIPVAIEIDPGARISRDDGGGAVRYRPTDQPIGIAILELVQDLPADGTFGLDRRRVMPPGMRDRDHQRAGLGRRVKHRERRQYRMPVIGHGACLTAGSNGGKRPASAGFSTPIVQRETIDASTTKGAMIRILLAEDDDAMRTYLTRALERVGYTVIAVDRGTEALKLLEHASFDLLLTDIMMPELDGIELAQRAAVLDPAIRVMFITGFAAVAVEGEAVIERRSKVLSKPFHLRELVGEVDRMFQMGSVAGG